MRTNTHVWANTYIHIHMHLYMCVCVCVCACVRVRVFVCVCIDMYTYVYMHISCESSVEGRSNWWIVFISWWMLPRLRNVPIGRWARPELGVWGASRPQSAGLQHVRVYCVLQLRHENVSTWVCAYLQLTKFWKKDDLQASSWLNHFTWHPSIWKGPSLWDLYPSRTACINILDVHAKRPAVGPGETSWFRRRSSLPLQGLWWGAGCSYPSSLIASLTRNAPLDDKQHTASITAGRYCPWRS